MSVGASKAYGGLRRRLFREVDRNAPEVPPGEFRLGKYFVLREVARGGMGIVYEAEDSVLRRRVALKILRDPQDDPMQVRRLHREAAIAAQLAHPNIVAVHEIGMVPNLSGAPIHFIAMDFIEGRTLAEVLHEGKTRRGDLLRMVEETALAVAHAHAKGVIHRDLKPSNVLVENGTGRVLLTDFGLARAEGIAPRLTGSHAVVGTPQYMAPEQVEGRTKDLDRRTDVYALGAMLYEVLTDRPPFVEETPAKLYARILKDEPARPTLGGRKIAAELEAICLKALEKDPRRRYPSAREFADDLRRFRQGEPIRARRIGRWRCWRRKWWRHKLPLALSAALVLTLVGAGAVDRFTNQRLRQEQARKERRQGRLSALWTEILERHRDRMQARVDPKEGRRRLEEAVREVDAFVAEDPTDPTGYYVRARGRLYLNDLEGAERDVRLALGRRPDFRPGWSLLALVKLEASERILSVGRSDFANYWSARAALVRDASEAMVRGWEFGKEREDSERWGIPWIQEDRLQAILLRALRECFRNERPEEGRRLLEDAYSRYRSEEFACWLGSFAQIPEERIAWYTEALRQAPGYARAYFLRGAQREGAAALADYDRAIELREDFAEAYVNRAGVKRRLSDPKGAIADCDRAVALRPDMAAAYCNRGVAKEDAGDPLGAMADYDRALELQDALVEVRNNRGVLRMHCGDFAGAMADYDRAIRSAPDLGIAFENRGILKQRLGDLSGTIADYDRAIELGAGEAKVYFNRGIAKYDLKDYLAAVADFDQALAIKVDYYQAYANRGFARQMTGDATGAYQDLADALRLAPPDWPERRRIEELLSVSKP